MEELGFTIKNGVYCLCSDQCVKVAKREHKWTPPDKRSRDPCPPMLKVSSHFDGKIDDSVEAPEDVVVHGKRKRKPVSHRESYGYGVDSASSKENSARPNTNAVVLDGFMDAKKDRDFSIESEFVSVSVGVQFVADMPSKLACSSSRQILPVSSVEKKPTAAVHPATSDVGAKPTAISAMKKPTALQRSSSLAAKPTVWQPAAQPTVLKPSTSASAKLSGGFQPIYSTYDLFREEQKIKLGVNYCLLSADTLTDLIHTRWKTLALTEVQRYEETAKNTEAATRFLRRAVEAREEATKEPPPASSHHGSVEAEPRNESYERFTGPAKKARVDG